MLRSGRGVTGGGIGGGRGVDRGGDWRREGVMTRGRLEGFGV